MRGDELVSVYLPTHNRCRLLERAISSVLRQSHRNIELIVADDGSSDGTREYLENLASSDDRVLVLRHNRPRGAPAARNLAILKARGRFITGLDDDDEFREDRIACFLTHWEKREAEQKSFSCLFSESVMVDGDSSGITTDRKERVVYHDLFSHNFIGNQVFCLTQTLRDIGGFDERMKAWQDLETFMRLLRQHGPALLVPDATYICHIERNRERISTKHDSLRSAFKMIQQKHADVPAGLHHRLFLQMFSKFYGFRPTLADWKQILQWRASPRIALALLRGTLRNSLSF
jgi:glycosyltransferase involved in cell wall biosynthesis